VTLLGGRVSLQAHTFVSSIQLLGLTDWEPQFLAGSCDCSSPVLLAVWPLRGVVQPEHGGLFLQACEGEAFEGVDVPTLRHARCSLCCTLLARSKSPVAPTPGWQKQHGVDMGKRGSSSHP
jgi:hypothetical protein